MIVFDNLDVYVLQQMLYLLTELDVLLEDSILIDEFGLGRGQRVLVPYFCDSLLEP